MFEDDILDGRLEPMPGMDNILRPRKRHAEKTYITPPSEPHQFASTGLTSPQIDLVHAGREVQLTLFVPPLVVLGCSS